MGLALTECGRERFSFKAIYLLIYMAITGHILFAPRFVPRLFNHCRVI
jgi:hypothetical protein